MKNTVRIMLCVLGIMLLSGCQENGKDADTGKYIYYVNISGTNLVKEDYGGRTDYSEVSVAEMLNALEVPEESSDYQSPLPEGVRVPSYILQDDRLSLYFGETYHKIDKVQEVLLRSSLVQSLVQIEGIDRVTFFINEEPLTDEEGTEYGWMGADDFVQNTGSAINSYQEANLTLYFANEEGDKLVAETRTIRYNSNTAMEKVIIEQLLKGPSEDGHYPTISSEAELLSVSLKDNICYVNFDDGIQKNAYNQIPVVPLYSIVNSLIENDVASLVQISVNGDSSVKFQGSVSLEKPLFASEDLLEGEE